MIGEPMHTLVIPHHISLETLCGFGREMDSARGEEKILIEFPESCFFSPFSMLFIAMKVYRFHKENPTVKIFCKGHEAHNYAAHMGFFKLIGLNYGRDVGEAWGSNNYLPITQLDRDALFEKDFDKFEEFGDLVQRRADKLAVIISRDTSEKTDLFKTLSYCIREIFRNVFEHSGADHLFYCAQYWHRSQKVEIAVADFGKGIRKALSENPNFDYKTDKEALEFCLFPTVSGKTHLPRRDSVYTNTGYGLYMTNRLARNGGNFALASYRSAMYFTTKTKYNYQTWFPGTILKLNLNISQIGQLEKKLHQFRIEGAEIAKTISGSSNRPPSGMSLMLRKDFQRR